MDEQEAPPRPNRLPAFCDVCGRPTESDGPWDDLPLCLESGGPDCLTRKERYQELAAAVRRQVKW